MADVDLTSDDAAAAAAREAARRRTTAYHESGHAIVSYLLGYKFDGGMMTCDPARSRAEIPGTAGMIRWPAGQPRRRTDVEILVSAAGPAAAARHRGYDRISWADEGDARDWADISDLARGPEQAPYIAEQIGRAVRLVEAHWDLIEALAERLDAAGTLTGAEAEAIIKAASRGVQAAGGGPKPSAERLRIAARIAAGPEPDPEPAPHSISLHSTPLRSTSLHPTRGHHD